MQYIKVNHMEEIIGGEKSFGTITTIVSCGILTGLTLTGQLFWAGWMFGPTCAAGIGMMIGGK